MTKANSGWQAVPYRPWGAAAAGILLCAANFSLAFAEGQPAASNSQPASGPTAVEISLPHEPAAPREAAGRDTYPLEIGDRLNIFIYGRQDLGVA